MTAIEESAGLDSRSIAVGLIDGLERSGLAASDDPLDLARAVGLALRAAQLLGFERIAAVGDELPASIASRLVAPEPSIDPERDPFVEHADLLGFVELLDLLSADELECIAPQLHRGWQDRNQSCREARAVARRAAGFPVMPQAREGLLTAAAIHSRLFRVPGPVLLETAPARGALYHLLQLVERLAAPEPSRPLSDAIDSLRTQLGLPG